GRRHAAAHVPHPKRHDAYPGRAAVGIDLQARRQARLNNLRRYRPVHKQQIAPVLVHQRVAGGALAQGEAVGEGGRGHGELVLIVMLSGAQRS
nr:hypothetical protein [Tanacetum cinerariifolium]